MRLSYQVTFEVLVLSILAVISAYTLIPVISPGNEFFLLLSSHRSPQYYIQNIYYSFGYFGLVGLISYQIAKAKLSPLTILKYNLIYFPALIILSIPIGMFVLPMIYAMFSMGICAATFSLPSSPFHCSGF